MQQHLPMLFLKTITGRQDEFPVLGAQVMAVMKGEESGPCNYRVVSRGKLKDHHGKTL